MITKINTYLLLLGLAFIFAACGNKEVIVEQVPAYVIQTDSMVHILADIHILEGAMIMSNNGQIAYKISRDKTKEQIYKKYGITKKRFLLSYDYYSLQNKELQKLYEAVVTEISKKQANLNVSKK